MKEVKLPAKFTSANRQIPKGSTVIDIQNRISVMVDSEGNHVRIDPITKRKVIVKRNTENEA